VVGLKATKLAICSSLEWSEPQVRSDRLTNLDCNLLPDKSCEKVFLCVCLGATY